MGTKVDPATSVVDCRLPIMPNKLPISDFRLPTGSDYRLPIVINNRKFADLPFTSVP